MRKFVKEIKKANLNFKRHVSLKKFCTYNIGGRANVFVFLNNISELKKFLEISSRLNQKFFVLGAGSKVLIDDKGLGVVIKLCGDFCKTKFKKNFCKAGCGVMINELSRLCTAKSLSGLEFGALLPASVGGATVMNAGAFGDDMAKIVDKIEVFDYSGKRKIISLEKCNFGYRKSIFQTNSLIITNVYLSLKHEEKEKIRQKYAQNVAFRAQNQPKGFCCGSIFKKNENFSAGYLIDKLGLKGAKCGYATVSHKHANFIVNLGRAKSFQVLRLMKFCQQRVYYSYGVWLEPEMIVFKEK